MQTLTGGSGNDSFVFNNNINFNGTINGDSGSNTLDYSAYVSPNAIQATVGGLNSGTVLNGVTTTFTGINTINGGAGNDTFTIGNTGSIGALAGNGGTNTLSYSGDTRVVSVNLQTGTATGVSSYSNITNFIGDDSTSGTNSTLTAANGTNVWAINAINAGNINSSAYTFSGFGNLAGNGGVAGSDTFNFSGTGAVTGNITGAAAGTETLNYTGLTGTPTENVTLTAIGSNHGYNGTAGLIGGSFSNIDVINDTASASNTLTGANLATTYTLSGANAGTVSDNTSSQSLTFSGFESLVGTDSSNTLLVLTAIILGRSRVQMLAVFSGLLTSFADMQTLTGGSGNDSFVFNNNINFNGTINGGTGSNTLDYSAYVSPNAIQANITGTNSGAVIMV